LDRLLHYGYDDRLVARCRIAVQQVIAMVNAEEFPFRDDTPGPQAR
jgi:hypothetical protein